MAFFAKGLPRGIREFQLGSSLKALRERFDPKEWGEYKVELHRPDSLLAYVVRFPADRKNPFRVVVADCPISDEAESLYDTSVFRLSFFYKTEVKQELGERVFVEEAMRKYGRQAQPIPTESGFYKIYRWEDPKTRIDLGLGYQFDRLSFVDTALQELFTSNGHQRHRTRAYHDLF